MAPITRREFASAIITSTALGAMAHSVQRKPDYRLAFSTLGCPKWEWKKILSVAAENGYSGIELRGLQGQMDLTKCPEFTGAQLATSVKDLDALNLKISDLGASARMHESDPQKRSAAFDEVKRFVDLANKFKSPYVRVFGDKVQPGETREATIERIITAMRELGEQAKGSGVSILLESHGDFTDSKSLLQILKGCEMPTTGFLWDAHHTFAFGREQPADTFKVLKKYIRHTHLKDSRPSGDSVQYVLTGNGTVPIRETVRVLAEAGYSGYYCFEWEKAWHPELEEPEIAFPHFAKVVKDYLKEAKR